MKYLVPLTLDPKDTLSLDFTLNPEKVDLKLCDANTPISSTGVDTMVNRKGFWVIDLRHDIEHRTYACINRQGLDELILHLTDRPANTYPINEKGLPIVHRISIATGLHIYG